MAKLHKNVSKYSLHARKERKIFGDKTWDQTHFLGTSAVKARDAAKAAENAQKAAENEPIMPLADEEELSRSKKKMLGRRNRGRASTILSDSETLG